jgi:hypothetical protein
MKYIAVLLCVLPVAGCASFKSKTHALFCVGVCVHAEQDTEKKKGDAPKDAAPVDQPPATS